MTTPLIYLASPYSDPDPKVMARRAACVAAVTARLLKEGKHVFSPIAYSHQFAVEHGMNGGWSQWEQFDLAMLSKCDEFAVLELPGWCESKGVTEERFAASVMPDVRYYIQPTPEELAVLDEPEHEWLDGDPHGPAFGEKPITQPEPKCKFWSDDDGGNPGKHCRYAKGERREDNASDCEVVVGSYEDVQSASDCHYFQPADEPKTATLSLGEDGMKVEAEHPCKLMCWNGCQFSSREDCPAEKCINFKPTEEKITKDWIAADELEAGKVHPCGWYDGDFEPNTRGCQADWVPEGVETPSICAWIHEVYDGIPVDNWKIDCSRFKPRETPTPEYNPNDVAFTQTDKLNAVIRRARQAQSELFVAMTKINELARSVLK